MPFTVTYAEAGINRRHFDVYLALLGRHGIDWTNTRRVPESGQSNRWLYVWDNRAEAEAFCEELKTETVDDKWCVRKLRADSKLSEGPLGRVLIQMRRRSLGADFSLHPHSKTLIRRRFPQAQPVSSISVEWKTRSDVEREHGPLWDHIAVVLTGLSLEQLATIEGYVVYDLQAKRTIHDSQATVAA